MQFYTNLSFSSEWRLIVTRLVQRFIFKRGGISLIATFALINEMLPTSTSITCPWAKIIGSQSQPLMKSLRPNYECSMPGFILKYGNISSRLVRELESTPRRALSVGYEVKDNERAPE